MTDLPVIGDPALFIVLMVVLLALGSSSLLAGWAEGRFSLLGALVSVAALGGFAWIILQEGFTLDTVPAAFVEIIARLVR